MNMFIPKIINRIVDYLHKEEVSSEDWNALWTGVNTALDYNTATLDAIINVGDRLVKNVDHATESNHSLSADNSILFNGRAISSSVNGIIPDSDDNVSTSKQVKDFIEAVVADLAGAGRTIETVKQNRDLVVTENVKNTQQDNRLNNIDNTTVIYGLDINTLKSRANGVDVSLSTVITQSNNHEDTLGDHEDRLLVLESGAAPEPGADYMAKAGYALALEGGGYSGNKVTYAYKADNVVLDGVVTNPNVFALKTTVDTLDGIVFKARGSLVDAAGASYTFGELKSLALGAYTVLATQADKLNIQSPYNQNGNLRLYPVSNGVSLEYEVQAGTKIGSLLTLFIPGSTPDATLFSTLTWECLEELIRANSANITTLTGNRMLRSDVLAGYDISLVNGTGNNLTIGYTGPKVVISNTNPGGTAGRQTLWIDLPTV